MVQPCSGGGRTPLPVRERSETGSGDRLSHVQEQLVAFLSVLHMAFAFVTHPQGTAGERKRRQTRMLCEDPGCSLVSCSTFVLRSFSPK